MTTLILLLVLVPTGSAAVFVFVSCLLSWLVFPGGATYGPQDTFVRHLVGLARVLVMEWLATLWVIAVYPFRFVPSVGPARKLSPGQTPVAVLPGHSENAITMLLLQRRLERALKVPVKAFSPRRYFGRLETLANEFKDQIEAWLQETRSRQVDLIGHSQGGLLARYLAESTAMSDRIRKVITLGSPHQGSALAVIPPGQNARQMRRGSGFLERLNASRPPKGIQWVGICSTHDNLVLPWHCSLSPRGDNYIIRFRGHISLIVSTEVVRLICKEIS
jgi:triacylglycerol lipase